MQIRVGIPSSFRRFTTAAASIGAPILVSANGLRNKNGNFRRIDPDLFSGCDVALDSAGFVAMVVYRGYPWSVRDYVALAASYPWSWWASMDFCCEREVAQDRDVVAARVKNTVTHFLLCSEESGRIGTQAPMPVIQGWLPSDYLRCIDLFDDHDVALPALVGIGSVCRRRLGGPDGLLTIVSTLDRHLPPHVQMHLFGAKGTAVAELSRHPRIAGIDSMAWDAAARRSKGENKFTLDWRIRHMCRWYDVNRSFLDNPQLRLPL